jgi:hypothetical protein
MSSQAKVTLFDLSSSRSRGFGVSTIATWRLLSDEGKPLNVRVCGPLHVNNTLSLRDAALAGLGIADLPRRAAPSRRVCANS